MKFKIISIILMIIIFVCFLSNIIFARYYEKIEYVEVKGIISEREQ